MWPDGNRCGRYRTRSNALERHVRERSRGEGSRPTRVRLHPCASVIPSTTQPRASPHSMTPVRERTRERWKRAPAPVPAGDGTAARTCFALAKAPSVSRSLRHNVRGQDRRGPSPFRVGLNNLTTRKRRICRLRRRPLHSVIHKRSPTIRNELCRGVPRTGGTALLDRDSLEPL